MTLLRVALLLLAFPVLAWAQPLSPTECQALRERVRQHVSVSAAARRALGITAPAAPSAAPSGTQDPLTRAETLRARLAQIREERGRLEDEKVGAIVKLDFARVAPIQERIEGLEQERRTLEAELAGLERGGRLARPGPSWIAPLPTHDPARLPCQDLPPLEERALRARRKELGGVEGQAALVPLLPLRGQTDRELASELGIQLGPDPEAVRRLGLLDQDGDTQVDGFVDSPALGMLRLYREQSDGSLALDLFLTTVQPQPDAPYGEAARRIEEALLRQTHRRLGALLPLRPVGPVKILGETGDFSRLRGLVDSGRFDQVIQAESLGARSLEFQNYRGETVRLLEVVSGSASAVQVRSATVVLKADGSEQVEETVMRFRPVSFWRTDVEVDQSREIKPAPGGPPQPRSSSPTVRFSLERLPGQLR